MVSGRRQSKRAAKPQLPQPQRTRPPRRCKQGPRFACPFAKHNALRYKAVLGPCTLVPGLEPKYVKEHVLRVHSAETCCLYCNRPWEEGSDGPSSMVQHVQSGECPQAEHIESLPEPMTTEQSIAINTLPRRSKDASSENWQTLYKSLFPDDSRVHEPHYDFYVLNRRGEDVSTSSLSDEDAQAAVSDLDFVPGSPFYNDAFDGFDGSDGSYLSQQGTPSDFDFGCAGYNNLHWQPSQSDFEVGQSTRQRNMLVLDIDPELSALFV